MSRIRHRRAPEGALPVAFFQWPASGGDRTGRGGAADARRLRRTLPALLVVLSVLAVLPAATRADHAADHAVPADALRMGLEGSQFLCTSGDGATDPVARLTGALGADQPAYELTNHGGEMVFWRHTGIISCGNDDEILQNDGFVVVDLADPARPKRVGHFTCVASASDVAIWNKLVFMAVDTNNTTPPKPWELDPNVTGHPGVAFQGPDEDPLPTDRCRAPVVTRDENYAERTFQGLHIVSIEDRRAPRLITSIRLDKKGVHNISLLPDLKHKTASGTPAPRLFVYGASPTDTVHVVEVPLDDPAAARPLYDELQGGLEDPPAALTAGCQDITFFLPRQLGVCNGSDGTTFWDISDPAKPERHMKNAAEPALIQFPGRLDHSSSLSWDGNMLILTDENRDFVDGCIPGDDHPRTNALWYYDVRDLANPRLLDIQGPLSVPGAGICYPKQVSIVPLRNGRDVATVSWVGGATTVEEFPSVDGTAGAQRIGYYRSRDQHDPHGTFTWAAYWYGDRIYANNLYGCALGGVPCVGTKTRGLDVLRMLDEHGRPDPEFADVTAARRFNFGTQECLPQPHGQAHGDLDC